MEKFTTKESIIEEIDETPLPKAEVEEEDHMEGDSEPESDEGSPDKEKEAAEVIQPKKGKKGKEPKEVKGPSVSSDPTSPAKKGSKKKKSKF